MSIKPSPSDIRRDIASIARRLSGYRTARTGAHLQTVKDALPKRPKTLHIFGQDQAHDPAQSVGDVEALKKLRTHIDAAIECGVSVSDPEEFAQNDGRGFHLAISSVDCQSASNLSLAYADEFVMPDSEVMNASKISSEK